MNRRKFLTAAATLAALPSTAPLLAASAKGEVKGVPTANYKLKPPASGSIPVAVVVAEHVNVVDLSGPWGVFESVSIPHASGAPFRLFTVAEKAEIVVSGSGLKIMPDYTFDNVPEVRVVVVPAMKGNDAMIKWLREVAPKTDVTMSICTGAFKLAQAGLLSGKAATTHHEFLDEFAKIYPDIEVKRGVRFVEGEQISTAAGLTSGTDLSLRVVERYFGRDVAQKAAEYMEYQGAGWIV